MADDWESALRKLTRETPKTEVMDAVMNAMRGDLPDRPSALVMSAATDVAIQLALVYALSINTQDRVNSMFYGDGPFSAFDKKIVAAFNLSIVGPTTATNLKVIKGVRNVFAHSLMEVTFSANQIVRACARIKLTKASQLPVDIENERKTRFLFGCACNEIYQGILQFVSGQIMAGEMGRRKLLSSPILP